MTIKETIQIYAFVVSVIMGFIVLIGLAGRLEYNQIEMEQDEATTVTYVAEIDSQSLDPQMMR